MGLKNTSENGSGGMLNAKGDFILEHEPSGNTFQYDEGAGAWVPISGLDLQGTENIVSVNSAQLADINNSGSPIAVTDDLDLSGTQSVTNVSSVSTDKLVTPPTGAIVQLNGNQSIANNTTTQIAWETEDSRGAVSGILDSTNNEVVVPSGYNWAKITIGFYMNSEIDLEFIQPLINGSSVHTYGMSRWYWNTSFSVRMISMNTAWLPVSQGDKIGVEIGHVTGTSVEMNDTEATYMEVELR